MFTSPWELAVVAVIIVLLFGRRLPELGTGLGKAISNFRKSYHDGNALDVTPKKEVEDNKEEDKE